MLEAARIALAAGKPDDAAFILRGVDLDAANADELEFLQGSVAVARKDWQTAIDRFRSMLARNPSLLRVRLDLALSYFRAGNDDGAAYHFRRALADDELPPVARARALTFLAQMRARKRWSVHVGFALAPDTNIGAGSDEETIYIFGLPFRRDAQELTSSGIGLRMEALHRIDRRTIASLRTSWHDRSYDRQEHLDGPTADISLAGRHALTPTVLADASFGWGYEKPETERYRHRRHWIQAGVSMDLPGGFTVSGSGTLRWANYEGNWFPFTVTGAPRNDITRSLRLSAHNRGFSIEGFSPQVSLVREDRTSNAQLYGYERTSGELRFVRLF